MSTGSYLLFTSDVSHIELTWRLRPACAEKWFAGCHLFHMPDSGTNAFDTYVWDPTVPASTSSSGVGGGWRHYPNSLLHYAENGTAGLFQPSSQRGSNTTWLIYLPLRNAPSEISLSHSQRGGVIYGARDGGGVGSTAAASPQFFQQPPVVWCRCFRS